MAFILATMLIDSIGIGLIVPVMPALLEEIGAGDLSRAALWGGALSTVFALMQMICGPVLGQLSDRYGRRPVLLISLLVMALDYLVMVFAGSLWVLVVARIVAGASAATYATANAFIADISKPEEKAANFGLVGAAFGLGFVIGPLIGGLLGEVGTRVPFMVAAGLAGLNFIFGYFVLPETVTGTNRQAFRWSNASPLAAFRQIREFAGLGWLLVFVLVLEFAFFVYPAIWPYFTKARFGWEEGMVGVSLAIYGICMALVQAVFLRWLVPRLGEHRIIIWGLAIEMVAFLFFAFVREGVWALCFIPISAMAAVVTPCLQGILSKAVSDDRQGALMGVVSAMRALATVIAPLAMTGIFYAATRTGGSFHLPGAPFLLALVLAGGCLWVFVRRADELSE